jgi:hypothetical protein
VKAHNRTYDDLEQLVAARYCDLTEAGYSPTDALALAALTYAGMEDCTRPDSSTSLPQATVPNAG